MAVELKVPSLGESITEVEIGQWLKREGDAVNKDESVVALESEKATVELPAPASGTLGKILKQTGQKASVGDVIAFLETSSKPAPKPEKAAPAPAPSVPSVASVPSVPQPRPPRPKKQSHKPCQPLSCNPPHQTVKKK